MMNLFSVEPDDANFTYICCLREAYRALPYDLGDSLFSGKPLASKWPALPHHPASPTRPLGDFNLYSPGSTLTVSKRLLDIPGARAGLEACAELLPIKVGDQETEAYVLHVNLLDKSLLDRKKTKFASFPEDLVEIPVLKKTAGPQNWLFRIDTSIYACGEDAGGFIDFYHKHRATGLVFKKVNR